MRPLPDWLPVVEVQRLIAAAEGERQLFLRFLWVSAARVGEACGLTWANVRLDEEPGVFLMGKGGDERWVPFYEDQGIIGPLRKRRLAAPNEARVFSYNTQAVRDWFKVFGPRHGYPATMRVINGKERWRHFRPHLIRHSAATEMLRRRPDALPVVAHILGHKNWQTTLDFYWHESESRLDRLRRSTEMMERPLRWIMAHPGEHSDLRPWREGP